MLILMIRVKMTSIMWILFHVPAQVMPQHFERFATRAASSSPTGSFDIGWVAGLAFSASILLQSPGV